MKTAEEYYKEYYPEKMHLFRDKHDRDIQLFSINDLLAFSEYVANAKAKALLEEAEKKIDSRMYFLEGTKHQQSFNEGIREAKESILSLIPKEQ